MNFLYNTGISLYSAAVAIASLRNRKARLMKEGQARTFEVLEKEVQPGCKYIWLHVSSLGEFEQGRPLIEMIKKNTPDNKIRRNNVILIHNCRFYDMRLIRREI